MRTPATEPLPRDGDDGSALAVCTIVAKNYLGMARVCCGSFLRHHPGARAFVLLADRAEGLVDSAREPFELLTVEELGIEGFPALAFQYDVLELSTALKPAFLRHLLERRGVSRLVYLDPDVEVFSPMTELGTALEESDIVLTPHVLSPLRDDGRRPNENDLLVAGVYNLGFLALRRSAPSLDLLHWWESRLKEGAFSDPARGLFTDQKWMNLAPGHFPGVRILRHPGYNAAYWNLQERLRLEPDGEGWRINGEPLRFFHFSGFQRKSLECVSRHQDRFRLSDLGRHYRALFSAYSRTLDRAGFEETLRLGYAFGRFDNGARIPDFVRRFYYALGERRDLFGDPFETGREESFFAWLMAPHRNGSPLSRLQIEMLRHRGDVAAAFPDAEGAHTIPFLQWVIEHSGPEMGLDGSWQERFREQLDAVVRARGAEEARADTLRRTTEETRLATSRAALETALAGAAAASAAAARLAVLQALSPPEDGGEPRTELKRWVEAALGRHRYRFLRRRFWDVKGRLSGGRAAPGPTSVSPEPAPLRAAPPTEAPSGLPEPAPPRVRPSPRPFGVNLFGYFDTESGIGEVARGLAAMLEAAKLPHVLVNVEQAWLRRECRPDLRFSGEHPYSVNLLAVNADQAPHVVDHFGLSRSPEQYFVGYWFWELSSFPVAYAGAFSLFDEIWAATDFCLDAFSRAGTIPVVKIPPALELPSAGRRDRSSFGFAESDFVFLYVFDSASVVTRKNPAGAIAAFRQAFDPGDPVRLVLKSTNAPGRTVQALERLAGPSRVQVWNGYLPRGELVDLVNASDAYVSLHRSEGLGLTVLEAMMLGKPVASTDYSGVRDFLRGPLAFPVAHEIVPLRRNHGPYPKGSVWAEPDTAEAARQMRRIHDLRRDVPEWPRIAGRASIEAKRRYGVSETASNLARRLAIIRATIEARRREAAGS